MPDTTSPDDPHATRDQTSAPGSGDPHAATDHPPAAAPGQRYRILRPHKDGGLGRVFVAHDGELRREVALKQIKDEHADDPGSRSRFVLEAEVTGRLEHPGIVPVYGLGAYADGRPFYAMRFVRGDTLQDAIAQFHRADRAGRDEGERALALRGLLGRFVGVCNAIAYAHDRGVLHRDLKPGNVMLGPYGETLVVDWGLAKAVGRSEMPGGAEAPLQPASATGSETLPGAAVGTPQYMSPEQAEGRLDRLGPASDVYSLGATLYCLLTGRAPFEGRDVSRLLQRVRQGDFEPPRRAKHPVPAALEAVCLKAMALRPEDRYQSASDLAREVERWLANEPVAAYREPLAVRARRWLRRHRTAVAAVGTALAVAVAGLLAGGLWYAGYERRQAEKERQLRGVAEQREGLARRTLYDASLNLAWQAWDEADIARVLELLESQRPGEGQDDLRGPDWHYLWQLCHGELFSLEHPRPLRSVAVTAGGRVVATGSTDGVVRLWDVTLNRERALLVGHTRSVTSVAFSPDGTTLASGSGDATVKLWDVATGKELRTLRNHDGQVYSVAFSPDGRSLASGGEDTTVRLWDVATGEESAVLRPDSGFVGGVAFSPDGRTLAVGTNDMTVELWDVPTRHQRLVLRGHEGAVWGLAFTRDGNTLASAGFDTTIRLWDLTAGRERATLRGHTDNIYGLSLSPDGRTLASASLDNTVKLWDVTTEQLRGTLQGHTNGVFGVAFSPDGNSLVSVSRDCTAKGWGASEGQGRHTLVGHTHWVHSVAFTPDGRRIATGSRDKTWKLWDVATGRLEGTFRGQATEVRALAFSADGRMLAATCRESFFQLWQGSGLNWSRQANPRPFAGAMFALAFSPDGKRLVSGGAPGALRVWDTDQGRPLLSVPAHPTWINSVAFSPDGRSLASAGADQTVKIWDAATWGEQHTLRGHTGEVKSVAFAPDGKTLASAGNDATVKLWDPATGTELLTLKGHRGPIWSVAFSPDGRLLASSGGMRDKPGETRLWDLTTGQELKRLQGHADVVYAVAFSPDGQTLATASGDKIVKLWDVAAELAQRSGTPAPAGK